MTITPAEASPDRVRAVVVGAGVIGTSVALELARRGHNVTVVDTGGAPGHGSTSASSGVVRYHYRSFDEAALAWEAGARWLRWGEHLGVDDPAGLARFHRNGLVLIDGPLIEFGEALANLHRLGVLVEELDAPALAARFPALDTGRYGPPTTPDDTRFWADPHGDVRAYLMPECGFVPDTALAAHNLAHAAITAGARILVHSRVVDVVRRDGQVAGVVLADGGELPADVVVNAAGPWSGRLNELAGVLGDFATSTRPLEQEVVSVPAPPGFGLDDGAPCVTDADLGTYFRPHPGGSVIVGGMEAPCDELVWLDSPDDARRSVSSRTWQTQTLRVARRLPALTVPSRPPGVVGVYDVTDDWIPIYDSTSLPGYFVAIGTSGHGFKQAPFVGELLADLVEACRRGHPHDTDPVRVTGRLTGHEVNLGHFSRLRRVVAQNAMG